jgi:hypothetical protein
MKVDSTGQFLWDPVKVPVASYENFKYGIQMTRSDSMYVACWSENRGGNGLSPYGNIYAQNISFNGKLGPLGISQLSRDNLRVRIFPNPSPGSSFLLTEESCPGPVTIHVYSQEGRLVQTTTVNSFHQENILRLDGTGLVSGTYIVEILTKYHSCHSKWIILR